MRPTTPQAAPSTKGGKTTKVALGLFTLAGLLALATVWLRLRSEEEPPIPRAQLSRVARASAPRPSPSRALSAARSGGEATISDDGAAAREAAPVLLPLMVPRWAPRAEDEWQGMLIDLNSTPPCETSSHCGLARACVDSKCMPCEGDAQCGVGEVCVLQHCVSQSKAQCRSASQCPAGHPCILTGYSSTPRGNDEMASYCLNPLSGAARMPESPAPPPPDTRTSLPHDALIKAAEIAARAE